MKNELFNNLTSMQFLIEQLKYEIDFGSVKGYKEKLKELRKLVNEGV